MESGQSSIRNKILAPVFKRLGIIEQWGNGLQLISDELKKYPEIGLEWKEPGMSFRVTFIKRDYKRQQESQQKLKDELNALWHQVGTKLALSQHQVGLILDFCEEPRSIKNIMYLMQLKDRTKFRQKFILPLIDPIRYVG
jgi:predicted HTH transcriptional regulator